MVIDGQGTFIEANPEAVRMTGYSSGELFQKNILDVLDANAGQKAQENFEILKELGKLVVEIPYLTKDGSKRWWNIVAAKLSENSYLGFHEDITDRKKALEEIKKAEQIAKAANQAKSVFLANMSHEIRTPINGIMGMLQLLGTTELDEEQLEYVEIALKSSDRLTRLLSDILDLTRIEAGAMTIHEGEFSGEDLKSAVLDLFGIKAREKGLELQFSIDPQVPPSLYGDALRIQQILLNLVGNAIKFTNQGRIDVHLEGEHQKGARGNELVARFSVRDTGIGIPKEKIPLVLAPFNQLETSYTRNYQGAGLGLSIVQKLTDLLGGSLSIVSVPTKGTTVVVQLPLKIYSGSGSSQSLEHEPGQKHQKILEILIVEDDPVNALSLQKLLEKKGHRVCWKTNGLEALEVLKDQDFHCVFMDVQLPIMTGLETTAKIRNSQEFGSKSEIPIIGVTAYAMEGDRERFLSQGFSAYVSKPVQWSKIQAVLDDLIISQ